MYISNVIKYEKKIFVENYSRRQCYYVNDVFFFNILSFCWQITLYSFVFQKLYYRIFLKFIIFIIVFFSFISSCASFALVTIGGNEWPNATGLNPNVSIFTTTSLFNTDIHLSLTRGCWGWGWDLFFILKLQNLKILGIKLYVSLHWRLNCQIGLLK